MKNYPPQFKADAVALYQSRPEATIRQVAADLGINPETLRNWVRAAGASRPRGRRAEAPAEVFEEQLRSLQQPGVATTG
ncbi:transposase [Streptomyces sp. NPDC047461]|uniref:transposase n=1 Tax=Streptomyces sp. NPDC047461 TaxID=3155619 RepID=UPI0033C0E4B3